MGKIINRVFEDREIEQLSKENPDKVPLPEEFFVSIALEENPGAKLVNTTIGDPMKMVVIMEK
ncbi:hypothetical protein [Olivibacter sp. XZL3]|uniref:hypothetical protein n=1 Tax=Olivibacter sp. XZL3 TaxID=1735116 RepID=UPI001066B61B|nr:hypothetical protein [Olivibacter sp. XZL3]